MNKKEQLLINAAKIIYEEGIQKLTIEYVAEKSDLTKGGVLYHFDTKANLLFEMNKMAIDQFEGMWDVYRKKLTGPSVETRAYALATLEFFNKRKNALLPAVFISSLENEQSYQLWMETSAKWERLFESDSGNARKNLQLRLLCDGIWFSILYETNLSVSNEIEHLVLQLCDDLKEEVN